MVIVMNASSPSNGGEPFVAQARGQATPSNRILVVDDDMVIRLLSLTVLAHSGYRVDTAEDGETAWEALHAENYDLLITDNNMPKVSGVELVKRLRLEDAALPVIMVSGAMPTDELDRNPWLHLAATLLKPFTPGELLGTVEKVLHEKDSAGERIAPRPIRQTQPSAEVLCR
jgi:DNA-binding response OmpR family regulator